MHGVPSADRAVKMADIECSASFALVSKITSKTAYIDRTDGCLFREPPHKWSYKHKKKIDTKHQKKKEEKLNKTTTK